jgi:two-component system LytT family response regulator
VDPVRLKEAFERAASLLALQRGAALADRLEGLLTQQATVTPQPPVVPTSARWVVRDADRLSFLETERIDWFESAGNYVRVHSGGRTYTMRTTMDRVAQRLAGRTGFIRVRRSAIVNVGAVATLERYGKAAFVVHLRNGTNIISSRYYHVGLRRLLRSDQ